MKERYSARSKGQYGEEIAVEYLKNIGYSIVDINYRNCFGEIDIIAKEGGALVFVEVKTRNTPYYGLPVMAVDFRKQQRMSKVAAAYITQKKLTDYPVRFDVVSVCGNNIEVIKDAFELNEGFLW